uniref:Tc1-like transposase DDE domain-containing protein n=2 Tax=Caenorhabditis japonica TaxID=281687 RepID=A0A8R1DK17_CAEJA
MYITALRKPVRALVPCGCGLAATKLIDLNNGIKKKYHNYLAILDSSHDGVLRIPGSNNEEKGPHVYRITRDSIMQTDPENIEDTLSKQTFGILKNFSFLEIPQEGDNWVTKKDIGKLVKNVYAQMEHMKIALGDIAHKTIFSSPVKCSAALLGVCERTIYRYKNDAKIKEKVLKLNKKQLALRLISPKQQEKIVSHIHHCYATESSFTVQSLLEDLQKKMGFPYGRTTLYYILKALFFGYKVSTYNPFTVTRHDIITWRHRFLHEIRNLRESGAFISYYDETWIYHGMTRDRNWNPMHSSCYEIAKMGNLENPVPEFPAASDKGRRATVLAILTESGILPGSVKVMVSNKKPEDEKMDYHSTMNAEEYKKYIFSNFASLTNACPVGRENILCIDNASYHNTAVEKVNNVLNYKFHDLFKIPTSASRKNDIADFLETAGLARGRRRNIAEKILIAPRMRPINCVATHPRKTTPKKESKGKDMDSLHNIVLLDQATYDKLNKKVRKRAIHFMENEVTEEVAARTFEHVIDLEMQIRQVMEDSSHDRDGNISDADD